MKAEEFTRKLPDENIEYGYSLRDYRKSGGGLRWSWAVEYRSGADLDTDYGYSITKFGARLAARWALLVIAFKMGARQK